MIYIIVTYFQVLEVFSTDIIYAYTDWGGLQEVPSSGQKIEKRRKKYLPISVYIYIYITLFPIKKNH